MKYFALGENHLLKSVKLDNGVSESVHMLKMQESRALYNYYIFIHIYKSLLQNDHFVPLKSFQLIFKRLIILSKKEYLKITG